MYYYDSDDNDEHDEDDLPEVSLSRTHYTNKITNPDDDEEEEEEHIDTNRSLENWRNIYETNHHSVQSDEDDQKSVTQKPFYLEQQPSIEKPPSERPDSFIETNTTKPKWEIQLPELLNTMVGPDRQKRQISRRHTTNIVFQQPQEPKPFSMEQDLNQPVNPLVKQLKQKFDQMTTNNHDQPAKLHRIASLTCRGLTANTGERIVQRSRPVLPVRPTPEIKSVKTRSGSIGAPAVNNRTGGTNNRPHRDKPGPPISYPKHYYPPPSTTSVVKQLIGSGATLVYDSRTQKSSSTIKPLIRNQKPIEQTREELVNTNVALTGRQLADYNKIKKSNTNNNHESLESYDADNDQNYYERIGDNRSSNSSSRKSIELPRRRSTSTNERKYSYSNFDRDIDK